MAGIDKTYTDSYLEYKEFKDWVDTQYLTFYNGHKVRIGDYVYDRDEDDFDGREVPIMNTPSWIDVYLIQNCKSKFVLDRLKDVYNKDTYNEFLSVDLAGRPPSSFQQNRKVKIVPNDKTRYPIHDKPFSKNKTWWVQSYNEFWYNSETKTWARIEDYYPTDTNTAYFKSIKALVRHLRKQYLPSGIKFIVMGRFTGEEYDVVIK